MDTIQRAPERAQRTSDHQAERRRRHGEVIELARRVLATHDELVDELRVFVDIDETDEPILRAVLDPIAGVLSALAEMLPDHTTAPPISGYSLGLLRDEVRISTRGTVAAADPVPVADEVRCRRLVIVDEGGAERIVAEVNHNGATVRASAPGLGEHPVSVAMVAGSQSSTAPGGGPFVAAGLYLDGAVDDAHAALDVMQRNSDDDTTTALDVGGRTKVDANGLHTTGGLR